MRCSISGVILVAAALLLSVIAQMVLRSAPGGYRRAAVTTTAVTEFNSPSVSFPRATISGLSPLESSLPPPPPPAVVATRCTEGPRFEHLQLNSHAKIMWSCWKPGADSVRAVFLTFGSNSMKDFLLNWVEHVKKLDQRLYLVGALDAQLAALCAEHGIPAATISDATLESMGAEKLGAHAATGYYRYAPGTFLRMGLIKQVFIREMLDAGLDAMVSDVDVAWLRSPWPLIRYSSGAHPPVQPRCKLLALADVVLSVDQVQQYMDTDKYYWHIGSDLNTGVAFFRNSPGAIAVLDEWKRAMAKAIAKRNPNHDQFWLNEVLQKRDFLNLKLDEHARERWLPGVLKSLTAADAGRVGLPARAADFNGSDPELRAVFQFKRKFGVPPYPVDEKLGEKPDAAAVAAAAADPSAGVTVTIGTFPIAEVSNGHTFFVQKLHDIVGVKPVCVHTTYQYGDSTAYAYGKRERLRDAHLWLLDTPSSHWSGKFLHLTSVPAKLLGPDKSVMLQPEAIDPDHCVLSHLKLAMLQRQWLMDGFLLAKALGRTLILPPLWCMLDRFWTILNHCLIGSQVEMPQPFVCPLDHSFNIPAMHDAGLEWREHTFLTNPRAPVGLAASTVEVNVGGGAVSAGGGAAGGGAAGPVTLAPGLTFAQAVEKITSSKAASDASVLRLDVSSLGKMCRCLAGMPSDLTALSSKLPRVRGGAVEL